MRRHLPLLGLLTTAALVAAAPAVPTAGDGTPRAAAAAPAGVRVVELDRDGPVRVPEAGDLEALLAEEVEPGDRTSLVDALARHVADAWGVDVVRVVDDETGETGETGGFVAWPGGSHWARGDFDADGLDDVLVLDWGGEETDLVALRGLDGAELWRVPFHWEGFGWPAGDLDGDGADDLVSVDFEWGDFTGGGDCDEDGCWWESEDSWTTHVSVRSGADGELRWTTSHSSYRYDEYDHRWTDDGETYHDHAVFTGLTGFPYPGDDHDGDGGRDLLVNVLDMTRTYESSSRRDLLTSEDEGLRELDSTTEATVVSGATGRTALGPLRTTGASVALLEGAGDVNADGRDDLLWEQFESTNGTWSCASVLVVRQCEDEEEPEDPTLAVRAIDGRTLESLWERRFAHDGWWDGGVEPLGTDVDGTPGDDVLVTSAPSQPTVPDPTTSSWDAPSQLSLLRGDSGATVWTAPRPLAELVAVTDMGGSPARDLLFSDVSYDWGDECPTWPVPGPCQDTASTTLTAVRLDGEDGTVLSDTSRTWEFEDDDASWFVWSGWTFPGDHDGDGVRDLAISTSMNSMTVLAVQSAASGEMLFERVEESDGWPGTLATPGDLDGDGADELMLGSWFWLATTVLRLPDATVLHEWTWPEEYAAGGDHDGVVGDELVSVRAERDGDLVRTFVESVHGISLAPRWSVELTPYEQTWGEEWPALPGQLLLVRGEAA